MNLRESFSLPYANTELWYSCLDSLKGNNQIIAQKVLQEERFIRRPSNPSLIAYHLYDTEVSYENAEIIASSLLRSQANIRKLAIIGLSPGGKHNFKKYLINNGKAFSVPLRFFDNFELAKEWLVQRGE
ncbi:MAG: hypothetical protein Q8930_04295 [Bacillota bacterium]|nr:hypothetical protein [Bacillota bacterium]